MEAKIAGEGGSIEIGDPVLPRREIVKSGAAIEVGRRGGHQITRLGELHDPLLDMPLLLTLHASPARVGIGFPEFGVEPLQRIGVCLDIAAKRLPVLLTVKLIFFGIFLLFAFLVFGFGNNRVQRRSVLLRVGAQEFRHVDNVVGTKFSGEIASGQVNAAMVFHPLFQLWRDAELGDEMIEVHEAIARFDVFAYIGKASRQDVKSHSPYGFRLAGRRPHVGGELETTGRGDLRGS